MIKLLTCFKSCLLDRNLLVTLFLSFYYLLYLKGLMCFVQVFQVTGIYVEEQELSMFNVLLIVIICLSLYFSVYGTFCTHVAFVSF